MTNAATLKPCPFCNGEKIRDGHIRDGRQIYCADCSASVTAFQPDASKHATSLWNCRPGEPAPSMLPVGSEAGELAEINAALKTINDTCLALQYDDRGRYVVETIEPLRNVAKLINKLVFQAVETDRLRAIANDLQKQYIIVTEALKPFAAAPYTGPNSFNRAALSDDDFRQARAALASPEGSEG
jgi:hypothetical protein